MLSYKYSKLLKATFTTVFSYNVQETMTCSTGNLIDSARFDLIYNSRLFPLKAVLDLICNSRLFPLKAVDLIAKSRKYLQWPGTEISQRNNDNLRLKL